MHSSLIAVSALYWLVAAYMVGWGFVEVMVFELAFLVVEVEKLCFERLFDHLVLAGLWYF